MAKPRDEIAAGASGHGRLRASHADRDRVIGGLKAAFVQGRLAKAEFDLRVGQALASRTYADLAALTADLPAGPATAPPPKPAWAPGEPRVPRPGLVLTVGAVVCAGTWLVAFALPESGPDHEPAGMGLIVGATFLYLILLLMIGTGILANWLDKRSGRQLPPGSAPGAGGQAPRRLLSPDLGEQLPPCDQGRSHTAEAARRRLPGRSSPGAPSLRRPVGCLRQRPASTRTA